MIHQTSKEHLLLEKQVSLKIEVSEVQQLAIVRKTFIHSVLNPDTSIVWTSLRYEEFSNTVIFLMRSSR